MTRPLLVLASTSPYRKTLLERLGLPFSVARPAVDETARPGEAPADLALRLAQEKAEAVAAAHPGSLIIGSDQVAQLGDRRLSKPGTHENAVAQLRAMSGKSVDFFTAVAVHDSAKGRTLRRLVTTRVKFRELSDALIESYLRTEQPYDCAGSAKAEGLGIVLIEEMTGADPNALIGLPLIALVDLLREHGHPPL